MTKQWYLKTFLAAGTVFLLSQACFTQTAARSTDAGKTSCRMIGFLSGSLGMDQISNEIISGLTETAAQSEGAMLSVYDYTDFEGRDFTGGVEAFLAMQGDFMIAFGTNNAADAADLVAKERVKLILLDTDTPENPEERIAFIGTDNRGAVKKVIGAVKEHMPSSVAAVFITHQHSTTFERRDEVLALANSDPGISVEDVYYLSVDSIKAFAQMKTILSEDSRINTILCLDGFSSQTAASVIPDMEKDYYTVGFDISQDTVKALQNGDFNLLVTQDYYGMGQLAVDTALNYQEGQESLEIHLPCVLYTDENAGELAEVYTDEEK